MYMGSMLGSMQPSTKCQNRCGEFALVQAGDKLTDPKLTAFWRRTGYMGESTSLETTEATRLLHNVYVGESSACYVMQPVKMRRHGRGGFAQVPSLQI